jgi:hypothetical protein
MNEFIAAKKVSRKLFSMNNNEHLIDMINELKLENANLQRRLISQSESHPDLHTNEPNSCRLCPVLERQIVRLHEELDDLRLQQSRNVLQLDTQLMNLHTSLSQEHQRRERMEQIIIRQKYYIEEAIRAQENSSASSLLSGEAGAFDFETENNQGYRDRDDRPKANGIVSHWALDMDDLSRQLQELNESLRRVEDQTSRLNSAAVKRSDMNQEVGVSRPSSGTVLGKAMYAIDGTASKN